MSKSKPARTDNQVRAELRVQARNSEQSAINPENSNSAGSALVANEQHIALAYSEEPSGPLPSPASLLGYHKIDPSFPLRLFDLAEGEAKHRRKLEEKNLSAQIWNERIAIGSGLMVAMTALIGAIYSDAGGRIALVLAPLATVVVAFVGARTYIKKVSASKPDPGPESSNLAKSDEDT